MSEKNDTILDEADCRWLAIVGTQPDLASAVELQRVLVTRSMELSSDTSLIRTGITAIPENIFERFKQQQAPVLELAVELNVQPRRVVRRPVDDRRFRVPPELPLRIVQPGFSRGVRVHEA